MILVLIGAQVADLVTFLRYAALAGPYGEVGPIGVAWWTLGPLGAIAFKLTGVVLIVACITLVGRKRPGLAAWMTALGIIVGVVGALANVSAYDTLTTALRLI